MCNIIRYTLSGAEEGKPAEKTVKILSGEFMLPDAEDLPAAFPQGGIDAAVAGLVVGDL